MGRMTLLPAWRSDGQVNDEQRQVTRGTRGGGARPPRAERPGSSSVAHLVLLPKNEVPRG